MSSARLLPVVTGSQRGLNSEARDEMVADGWFLHLLRGDVVSKLLPGGVVSEHSSSALEVKLGAVHCPASDEKM